MILRRKFAAVVDAANAAFLSASVESKNQLLTKMTCAILSMASYLSRRFYLFAAYPYRIERCTPNRVDAGVGTVGSLEPEWRREVNL